MQFVTKLTLQGSTYIFSASIPRGFTSLFSFHKWQSMNTLHELHPQLCCS